MKKTFILDVFIAICSKWWIFVPLSSVVGALFVFVKEANAAETSSTHVMIGAIWGAALGLLIIPLSMSKTRNIESSLISSLIVALAVVATGLLLNWLYDSIIIGAIVGALIGTFARWWAPHINLP